MEKIEVQNKIWKKRKQLIIIKKLNQKWKKKK